MVERAAECRVFPVAVKPKIDQKDLYMSAKSRIILVLATAVIFYVLLYVFLRWSAFSPSSWMVFISIVAVFVLGIAPIYYLSRTLKKRPLLSSMAILLLIVATICGLAGLTGNLILHVDTIWVSVMTGLSKVLFVASCVLFIWSAFAQKGRL